MKQRRKDSGYTLIEMAMAITVLGMLTGMLMSMMTGQHEAEALKSEKKHLKLLDEALAYHVKLRGRLPCPANPTLPETDANFGREDCIWADTTRFNGASANEHLYFGMVPTRTLAIADRYLYDAWGNRAGYAVIAPLTVDAASFNTYTTGEITGVIHITDAAGNPTTQQLDTNVVAYAIISYGKDKKGGYNRVGAMTTACTAGSLDSANCDNADNTLVDAEIADTRFAATYYHDLLRWRDLAQLKAAVDIDSATPYYTYVADTGNDRVLKFNPDGTYLSTLDSSACPTSASFNGPQGIAVDSSDNVYVADTGNGLIKKFDSDGVCSSEYDGDTQAADFDPSYIAINASGEFYVVDPDDDRIIILNADGSYNSQFNGTGSSGTFDAPTGIVIDNNDDVYIADTGNNLVKKFNSDGTFDALEFDGTTGGGTAFTGVTGIAMDGNIILAIDSTLNNLQKYDSSGSYLGVINDGGSLAAPQTAAVNASGYIYILDTGNNVVRIFNRNASTIGSINASDAPAPAGFSGPMGIGVARQ